ncbi:MAG: V-type ATP synthase subunit F [Ruminococcaceae bacterium]|nr:V-type ATP synthase subunit F [Oscillospiraceae bacterium]
MQMYKIAVLGDKDSVLGFRALGLDVFSADSAEQARPILHRLAREGYAIIYLTEQLATGLSAEMARYKDELTPAIILIPGKEGSLGIGMENIKTAVERAVGADIL